MANKKPCPSCGKEVNDAAVRCPECKEQLEILNWEIETGSGEKRVFSSIAEIRDRLINDQIHLSDGCRQFREVLVQSEDGRKQFDKKEETEWKSVKDFADKEFLLLSLYDPRKAYGNKVAENTAVLIGILVAVGWVMDGLVALGAPLLWGLILSVVLLVSTPTIIPGAFITFLVANAYGIAVIALVFRIIVAYLVGALAGAAVGFTIGRLIGRQIGSRKPILVTA